MSQKFNIFNIIKALPYVAAILSFFAWWYAFNLFKNPQIDAGIAIAAFLGCILALLSIYNKINLYFSTLILVFCCAALFPAFRMFIIDMHDSKIAEAEMQQEMSRTSLQAKIRLVADVYFKRPGFGMLYISNDGFNVTVEGFLLSDHKDELNSILAKEFNGYAHTVQNKVKIFAPSPMPEKSVIIWTGANKRVFEGIAATDFVTNKISQINNVVEIYRLWPGSSNPSMETFPYEEFKTFWGALMSLDLNRLNDKECKSNIIGAGSDLSIEYTLDGHDSVIKVENFSADDSGDVGPMYKLGGLLNYLLNCVRCEGAYYRRSESFT